MKEALRAGRDLPVVAASALSSQFDGAAYDSIYSTPTDLAENAELRRILLDVVRDRRVADLGCGTGLAYELLGEGPNGRNAWTYLRYVGVDPAASMIRRAREKWPGVRFYRMTAEDYLTGAPAPMEGVALVATYGAGSFIDLEQVARKLAGVHDTAACIMVYGHARPLYAPRTFNPHTDRTYSPDALKAIFGAFGLTVQVRGLLSWSLRLPYWTPGWALSALSALDAAVWGRHWPHKSPHLIVTYDSKIDS